VPSVQRFSLTPRLATGAVQYASPLTLPTQWSFLCRSLVDPRNLVPPGCRYASGRLLGSAPFKDLCMR